MNIILRTCDSLVLNALQLFLRSYYDTHAKLAINLDKKETKGTQKQKMLLKVKPIKIEKKVSIWQGNIYLIKDNN